MDAAIKTKLIDLFEGDIARGQEAIEKFKSDLDLDPEEALRWADNMFSLVPALMYAKRILNYIKSDDFDENEVVKHLEQRVLQHATSVASRSTNQCRNLLVDGSLGAFANNLATVRDIVSAREYLELDHNNGADKNERPPKMKP